MPASIASSPRIYRDPFYNENSSLSSEESDDDLPVYADHELPTWDPSSAADRKTSVSRVYDTVTVSNNGEEGDEVSIVPHQESSSKAETDGVHDFEKATKLYGNPLAVDDQWSVVKEDLNLIRLPKIGVGLTMKNSFRTVSDPSKHDRPGFNRDPHKNPLFNAEMEFGSVRIPNKHRRSRFVGTGFRRVYDGHVFARHDVSPADWQQFLYDITAAGTSAIGTIPFGRNISKTRLPFIGWAGDLMQLCHEGSARKVIDVWQQKFFTPRGLCIGVEKLRKHSYMLSAYDQSQETSPQKLSSIKYREQRIIAKDYGRTLLLVSKLQ